MDLTFFGLLPMLFGGAPADSPRALLDTIYEPLIAGEQVNLEEHYSDRLQMLVSNNLALNAVEQTGTAIDPEAPAIVEFNPFLNGTDTNLSNLSVTEPVVQGQTAVALVSFGTNSVTTILTISMINDSEWKIDDIASVGSGEKWLYSWLLQYDPFNQQ